MNLMIIDEGFGVFDTRHNKQLVKMLEPLESIFKQIFIITHLDELQSEIPYKIKIKHRYRIYGFLSFNYIIRPLILTLFC